MDGYDACFKCHVDESIKEMTNKSYRNVNEQVLKQQISVAEVDTVIQGL